MGEPERFTGQLRAGADFKMMVSDEKNMHGFLSLWSGLHDFLLAHSSGLLGDLRACTPENACGSDKLNSLNTLLRRVAFIYFREVTIKLIFVIDREGKVWSLFSHPWYDISRRWVFHKNLSKTLVIFLICMVVYNLEVEASQATCYIGSMD